MEPKDMISIKTYFTRQIVSKAVAKWLKNKFKKDVEIGIGDLDITRNTKETMIHIDGVIKMNSTDLELLVADICNGKEE